MPICAPTLVGPQANLNAWEKRRTTKSVRCKICRGVFPGQYQSEVDATNTCKGCKEKGKSHG